MVLTSLAPLVLSAQAGVPKPVISTEFSTSRVFQWPDVRTVQACHAAVVYVKDSVRQYWRDDTLYIDVDRPTPVAVADAARQCLDRFPPHNADPLELPLLLQVALLTGDTVAVKVVMNRLLAVQTDMHKLADVLTRAMGIQPVSIPFMQTILEKLDSLGTEAFEAQIIGRKVIYETYRRRGVRPDSIIVLARETLAAIQRIMLTKGVQERNDEVQKIEKMMIRQIAWYTYLRDGTPAQFQTWREQVVKEGQVIGRFAPMIEGEFWIGGAFGDTTTLRNPPTAGRVPFPGQVTLVTGQDGNGRFTVAEWNLIRRIHNRFPAIKIVLLAQTTGNVLGSNLRVDTPAMEADLLGQFYRDSLQLPVWLNVSQSVIDTSRRDDLGRPAIFASSTYEAWGVRQGFTHFYVINREGNVVHRIDRTGVSLHELWVMLERLLQMGGPAAVPSD